jgi:hypothetical protein
VRVGSPKIGAQIVGFTLHLGYLSTAMDKDGLNLKYCDAHLDDVSASDELQLILLDRSLSQVHNNFLTGLAV